MTISRRMLQAYRGAYGLSDVTLSTDDVRGVVLISVTVRRGRRLEHDRQVLAVSWFIETLDECSRRLRVICSHAACPMVCDLPGELEVPR